MLKINIEFICKFFTTSNYIYASPKWIMLINFLKKKFVSVRKFDLTVFSMLQVILNYLIPYLEKVVCMWMWIWNNFWTFIYTFFFFKIGCTYSKNFKLIWWFDKYTRWWILQDHCSRRFFRICKKSVKFFVNVYAKNVEPTLKDSKILRKISVGNRANFQVFCENRPAVSL